MGQRRRTIRPAVVAGGGSSVRRARVGINALVALAAGPGLQVLHLLRKVIGRVGSIRVQGLRRAPVAARGAADAEVETPRRQGIKHAKLLGHLEG